MANQKERVALLVRLLALARQLGTVEQVHMYEGGLLCVEGLGAEGPFRLTLDLEAHG